MSQEINEPRTLVEPSRSKLPPDILTQIVHEEENDCPLNLSEQRCWMKGSNRKMFARTAERIIIHRFDQSKAPIENTNGCIEELESLDGVWINNLSIEDIGQCTKCCGAFVSSIGEFIKPPKS